MLLGMDFFFKVKLLLHFHLFRNIPYFIIFQLFFERIALLYYFRWLVESLITYFDIFHSWNIYVNGFQQA